MEKIISTNSMNSETLNNFTKDQLINMVLNLNEKLQQINKPVPAPRKNVKQMIKSYEENIIQAPTEYLSQYQNQEKM